MISRFGRTPPHGMEPAAADRQADADNREQRAPNQDRQAGIGPVRSEWRGRQRQPRRRQTRPAAAYGDTNENGRHKDQEYGFLIQKGIEDAPYQGRREDQQNRRQIGPRRGAALNGRMPSPEPDGVVRPHGHFPHPNPGLPLGNQSAFLTQFAPPSFALTMATHVASSFLRGFVRRARRHQKTTP